MQPVVNEDGLCYTYNNVDFKVEEGMDHTADLVNIPGVGHKKGLTLVVDSHKMKTRAHTNNNEYLGNLIYPK